MSPDPIDLQALADELTAKLAPPTPSLLDATEAGELLHVPSSWVLSEARAERIPAIRLGKYVRFRRDDLVQWVDGRTVGPVRK